MSALLSMKKDASNDDLLTKSVEEKADDADVVDFKEATIDSSKLSKLLSTSSLNDPEWKRADGSVVERVTEKGFNCATFTHYDIKKNIALVEIVVERDTAHDQFKYYLRRRYFRRSSHIEHLKRFQSQRRDDY